MCKGYCNNPNFKLSVFIRVEASTNFFLISQNIGEAKNAHAAVLKDLREAVGFLFFRVAIEGGAAHCEHFPSLFRADEVVLIRCHDVAYLRFVVLC